MKLERQNATESYSGKPWRRFLRRLIKDTLAQDLVEYVFLMVLIGLVAVASMTQLGNAISNVFEGGTGTFSQEAPKETCCD